uniref:LIM zinc-binding domain-containing protein n=1 Tax=Heterorhabditis bacteriophora TaxID=37862 RepID=A0A1I7WML6_HETBA
MLTVRATVKDVHTVQTGTGGQLVIDTLCTVPLDEGDICVFAARTDTVFHPACFHCHECRALLVDLIYFAHDGQIFCGRHHAEQIKPRCARCDELIFGEECTEAEGRTWHLHHFQCSECADVLGGKKYMQRNNKPVCLSCFHSAESSLVCATCRGNIPVEHPHISQGDLDWHADARCFSCCVCSKNLLGKKYSLVDASLYCGFKTCGGDDELLDMDRLHVRTSPEKIPSSLNRKPPRIPNRPPPSPRLAPRPPQRAPPPPPSENIYETVLPCTSSSPEFEKKYGVMEFERGNYYSRTPSKILGRGDTNGYSTSSSDSEEDETFYINNLMAAASLSRAAERRGLQQSGIRMAKKKKRLHTRTH